MLRRNEVPQTIMVYSSGGEVYVNPTENVGQALLKIDSDHQEFLMAGDRYGIYKLDSIISVEQPRCSIFDRVSRYKE